MMKHFLTLTLIGVPALAGARMADTHCDDHLRMTQMMTETIGAERRGMGLRGPETVLEVWIEPRSGDWTLVQSYSNGTACIVAMGAHWEDLAPEEGRS